jgi:DNA-binding response OmpR family regulator
VRLPARIPPASDPADAAAAPSGAAGPKRLVDTGRVVLVIDGDLDFLELTAWHLTRWGFRAVTASRGREGLRLAREIQPFAILLDIALRDMDGWTVLRTLKKDTALKPIPVVVSSTIDESKRGEECGAVDFMVRPTDWAQLFRTLAAQLPRGDGRTALMVDDDPMSREVLRRSLERAGWTVAEAVNGGAGLAWIRDNAADLIVLDLMKPEMGGKAFLQEVKLSKAAIAVPVVVVTAEQMTDSERYELHRMADTVIDKEMTGWNEMVRVAVSSIDPRGVERAELTGE